MREETLQEGIQGEKSKTKYELLIQQKIPKAWTYREEPQVKLPNNVENIAPTLEIFPYQVKP